MTHTNPKPASRRTQLLFGAFVLTMAIGLNTASSVRSDTTQAPTAILLRSAATSDSRSSVESASSRSRAPLLRSTRQNIRSRIVRPIRRRSGTGSLRNAASSVPRTPIKAGCGDKLVTGTEKCDDGNVIANDGCSASCLVETGYECDGSQPSLCWSRCGDGVVAANEKCDDANTNGGDGCNATCRIEFFYTCTASPSVCKKATICGDTVVEGAEQCDDGNTNPGDGCSATCKNE